MARRCHLLGRAQFERMTTAPTPRLLRVSRGLLLLYAAVALSPARAHAEDGDSRVLADHVFLYPTLVPSALLTSYVGIRETFAVMHIPNLGAGSLGERDVSLTGLQQTLDLGFQFSDLIGISGFARGTALAGTNRQSIIIDGASVNYEVAGNVGVRLYRNASTGTQLTARAEIGYKNTQEIAFLQLLEDVAEEPRTIINILRAGISSRVLVPTEETELSGGLMLAQAFSRVLSLQASGRFDYAFYSREPYELELRRRTDQDGTLWRMRLGAAFGVDFEPMRVPIALLGEYLLTVGDRSGSSALPEPGSNTFSLGAFYSGRTALQVGLSTALTIDAEAQPGEDTEGNTSLSDRPTVTTINFILRYTW
jgi:hypothetical protein